MRIFPGCMKKTFFLICCLIAIQNIAAAQTTLKLKTAPMRGAQTVILPTCDNLLGLLHADSAQFAAVMKLNHYIENLKTPGAFYAASNSDKYQYYIVRKKGDIAIMLSQFSNSLNTLNQEVKKRFSYAAHDTGTSLEETYYVRVNIKGQMLDCMLLFDTVDTGGLAGAQIKINDYRFK
jgi:hypothetical protein